MAVIGDKKKSDVFIYDEMAAIGNSETDELKKAIEKYK